MKATNNNRQTFTRSLNSYDEAKRYTAEDYYEVKEIDRKLSNSVVTPSSIICDVGGESGVDAFSQAMLGSFCVCLDINKNAVRLGKILSEGKGLQNKLEFVMASATNLPFRSGSFNLVTCFSVLDHLPAKEHVCLAVREFSRVVEDFGYVAITIPNKLFVIGSISMKMKHILDAGALFERRFTPREIRKIIIQSGLMPIALSSKYPTKIGPTVLKYNLPRIVSKIPRNVLLPFLLLAASLFCKLETRPWLQLCGARLGYLSQKISEGSR